MTARFWCHARWRAWSAAGADLLWRVKSAPHDGELPGGRPHQLSADDRIRLVERLLKHRAVGR